MVQYFKDAGKRFSNLKKDCIRFHDFILQMDGYNKALGTLPSSDQRGKAYVTS